MPADTYIARRREAVKSLASIRNGVHATSKRKQAKAARLGVFAEARGFISDRSLGIVGSDHGY